MSDRTPERLAVRRLVRALAAGGAGEILAAGHVLDAMFAASPARASALLEAVLIAPGGPRDAGIRARLADACTALATDQAPATVLATLWTDLARLAMAPGIPPPPRATDAIAAHLVEHLGPRTTLQGLAHALGYSPAHVSVLVRRVTGERFSTLRRRMQLQHARLLLERGASVKVAALESGFDDPAYFSRVFTRTFGVAPSRWPRRADGE